MASLSGDAFGCSPTRDGCATMARLLGGDPAGSSGHMTSWLLIEQPGPWSPDAADRAFDGIIDPHRMAELRKAGMRPLLIRRPGRHPRSADAPRTVFLASGRP